MKWDRECAFSRPYMGTLWASSGSTLGHGPTTRTHAFRRPPKRERGRPRHTHTHTIYAVRRVYSAGAHPVASPPSPVSHRLASASLAVSEPIPAPPAPPHLLFPQVSLRASGAAPTVSPPEWREYERHGACVAHTQSCPSPFPHHHPLPPHQHCLVSAAAAIVFSLSLWPSPPPPLIGAF